jgi:hypothetical protein
MKKSLIEKISYIEEDKNNSHLNESFISNQEELIHNRKFITYIIRSLNQKRIKSMEMLHIECLDLLKQYNKDITNLIDEDKNNRNLIFYFILVAHILIKEDKFSYLRSIVEAYYHLIDDKDKFYNWLTNENSENMTPLEIAAHSGNKEIIKYLYDIFKKANEERLKISSNRNNLFHYAAKSNQSFSLVK